MLFKIDENLHEEVAELFRRHGHDALSVYEQQLCGSTDVAIATVCQREGRALVTQDLDFANIFAFPPEQYAGLIVLRLHNPNRPSAVAAVQRLLPLLATEPLVGCLWSVDDFGVRIRGRQAR